VVQGSQQGILRLRGTVDVRSHEKYEFNVSRSLVDLVRSTFITLILRLTLVSRLLLVEQGYWLGTISRRFLTR
jgi:hypothetical protein